MRAIIKFGMWHKGGQHKHNRHKRSQYKREGGFALVDVLVALTIASLISLVAVRAVSGSTKLMTRGLARMNEATSIVQTQIDLVELVAVAFPAMRGEVSLFEAGLSSMSWLGGSSSYVLVPGQYRYKLTWREHDYGREHGYDGSGADKTGDLILEWQGLGQNQVAGQKFLLNDIEPLVFTYVRALPESVRAGAEKLSQLPKGVWVRRAEESTFGSYKGQPWPELFIAFKFHQP